jgi:hypothetical protein
MNHNSEWNVMQVQTLQDIIPLFSQECLLFPKFHKLLLLGYSVAPASNVSNQCTILSLFVAVIFYSHHCLIASQDVLKVDKMVGRYKCQADGKLRGQDKLPFEGGWLELCLQ